YWKDKLFSTMNNFKKMKHFFWVAAAAISFTACKSVGEQQANNQTDEIIGRWELVEQTDIENPEKSYPEGLPVLSFEESGNTIKVFGYDGCNQIRTTVKARKNGNIQFDEEQWISTMMFCENVADQQFKQAVLSAKSYA